MPGRGAEFETVLGLLDDTRQGQGLVPLVEGEPAGRPARTGVPDVIHAQEGHPGLGSQVAAGGRVLSGWAAC
jgi:hypothetical protein